MFRHRHDRLNYTTELRPKHPVLAAVTERGHQMDLKETFAALIVVDALKEVRKLGLIGLIISS